MARGALKGLDEVLEEIPFGRFHVITVLLCGFAYVVDGFVTNLVGFTSDCIGEEFTLEESYIAKFPTVLFCGAIIGGFVFAQVADGYGRRFAMLFSQMWITVSILFTSLLATPGSLLFGYFLIGFGTGGAGITFDYISEVVAPNLRVLCFAVQCIFPVSTLIVSLLGWWILGSGGTWRTLMQAVSIPMTTIFAVSYFVLPESARWLLDQHEVDKAEGQVMVYAKMNGTHLDSFSFTRGFYKDTQREEQENEGISFSGVDGSTGTSAKLSKKGDGNKEDDESTFAYRIAEFSRKVEGIFTDPEMRHSIILMGYILFNSLFSKYAAVFLQARLLESTPGSDDTVVATCNFDFAEYLLSAPAEFLAALLVVFTTDWQGRRWSMFTWAALVALFSLTLSQSTENSSIADIALLGMRFAAFGSEVASWTPATELFNTQYRATAFSICFVMSRVGAMLAATLVDSTLSTETICIVVLTGSVLSAIAALMVKETKGEHMD